MSQPKLSEGKAKKWLAYAFLATIFLLILGGTARLFSRTSQPTEGNLSSAAPQSPANKTDSAPAPTTLEASLKPAENWQANNHIHGLTVSPDNPQIIYIASHSGLLKRSETGQWFWIKEQYDYMGFIAHPTDANRFYASGHPPEGGNLGFQVSQNQGLDWQEVSMPGVDFHAMAIAPSNPDTIYGLATSGKQGFFVSNDAGQTWTQPSGSGLEAMPFSLNVDPLNPERVLATTQAGLYESQNAGKAWSLIPSTATSPIAGLALRAEGDQTTMLGYRISSTDTGLYRSVDGGQSWEPWSDELEGIVLYMAVAPTNSQVLYAVNENNAVFQSQDGGKTWDELNS
ncbi:hypothetical protein IQ265_06295 [Nodosilinea sp. LEGE 06152]|uniref:F510_1955 family glycosylhydrolase n=1 Tax=Nodosilinea sp. LEGE 06152 TaxID=2777966 RepID=UPI00187E0DDE|nr:hypothetical protein [Nodosilinea sp. LEGE 06152]MBE9156439.1 hypothetical protein [Nodosilinea sp. LEGE 06152]